MHRDNFVIGILIYSFILGLEYIPINLSFLDPVGDAFEDVEISDVVYSQMGKNRDLRLREDGVTPQENSEIVIINVGGADKSRRDIAAMVNVAAEGGAKVIALDVFFEYMKPDTMGDYMLQDAFKNFDNLVLVNKLLDYNDTTGNYSTIKESENFFNQHAINGFANMVTKFDDTEEKENGFKVCRKFLTKAIHEETKDEVLAFPLKVCQLYDSTSLNVIKKRDRLQESIDFVGNIWTPFPQGYLPEFYKFDQIDKWKKQHFPVIEHNCVINRFYEMIGMGKAFPQWGSVELDFFKNKIVLIGYVGDRIDIDTGEDKFFTPLNEKYIGKANRDMYGIVVHANIISTILGDRYSSEMADWQGHLFGIFLVYLVFAMFRPIYDDFKVWYDGVTKTMSLILSMFILFVIGWLFAEYDYKLKLEAIYFGCILLAGDFLEIYYGLIRNVARKVKNKFVSLLNR